MNTTVKPLLAIILATLFCTSLAVGQSVSTLDQKLFDLPDVRFEKLDDLGKFSAYMLHVKQPINHQDESSGHFYQRVKLVHRGYDAPTLINTNGYNLEEIPMELFDLLKTNFVSVEHRYFGPSTPDPKDWDYLTIEQATADYHRVRQILGQLYPGKWVSTGISKGGETATYYKYYYPDDIDVTVAYVAPFPIGLKDQRVYKFLDSIGTEECRKKIFEYQKNVLKAKTEILPRLRYYLRGKGAKVKLIGGPEAALELFVLEYPFSFWQSGKSCKNIPADDADPETLLNHLIDSGDYWYLLDKSTENLAAHYYQHATQLGYYGYQTERFGDLIKKWQGEPSACFFPHEQELKFDPKIRNQLTEWLKTDARDIVFLYGGNDTWSVAQAEIGDNKDVKKFIFEGKHHGNARLRNVEPELRDQILDYIKPRLESK